MNDLQEPTAPGYEPGAVGLPWYRRALEQGAGYFLPNLVFLVLPAWYSREDLSSERFSLLIVGLVVVAAVFMGTTLVVELRGWQRWSWLALLITVICIVGVISGGTALLAYYTPYMTASTALLVPWRSARLVIGATMILGLAIALLERDLLAGVLALIGAMVGFSVSQGLYSSRMAMELKEAHERTAVLAVAAERERIGRDLHDILGHSLTTIAVKADLASRLTHRDADAAEAETDEIATIARQALADVRATASGMKEVRLATEIASARAVLEAAGILAHTPSSLPPLDDDESELLGYVVREGITNVLRHSNAAHCRITAGEGFVEVHDDGDGFRADAPRSGLKGLEQRLAAAGWRLVIDGDDGASIRAEREDT